MQYKNGALSAFLPPVGRRSFRSRKIPFRWFHLCQKYTFICILCIYLFVRLEIPGFFNFYSLKSNEYILTILQDSIWKKPEQCLPEEN